MEQELNKYVGIIDHLARHFECSEYIDREKSILYYFFTINFEVIRPKELEGSYIVIQYYFPDKKTTAGSLNVREKRDALARGLEAKLKEKTNLKEKESMQEKFNYRNKEYYSLFAEIYLNEPITFLKNDYEGIGSIRFLESSQVEKMMGDEGMSSEE